MTYRWLAGPVLGILVLVVFLSLPPLDPFTPTGMKTIGIFCFTVAWWISLGIDFPSIICILLLIVTGVSTPEGVFAFLGHWIIFFVLGCFGMSESLKGTGFSHRFAFWFLTRPFAKDTWPGASAFLTEVGLATPALAGASLLCLIRIKKKPLLTFSQWMGA